VRHKDVIAAVNIRSTLVNYITCSYSLLSKHLESGIKKKVAISYSAKPLDVLLCMILFPILSLVFLLFFTKVILGTVLINTVVYTSIF
jgi:hypothetical protein